MAKKQFKSESKRLLDLMINSIYTHKEIFLRELISNASDAIDKYYYLSLADENVSFERENFYIRLTADKENRKLILEDTGIGMTKEELEENLGTIAKSGSFAFKNENEAKEDVDIIGQFGVGFYSAFMVAEKVEVVSKKFDSEEAYKWTSTGADGYTVTDATKEKSGTTITLYLKPDTDDEKYSEFLDEYRIKGLIRKYSDYIKYPIKMDVTKKKLKEGSENEYEDYTEEETLNSMTPLWRKNKSELTSDDYNAFYKEKFFDFEDPLRTLHTSADGMVSYTALLYIPKRPPFDYYTKDFKKGLSLYTNGVMIMDKCEDLLPDYFAFVKGLVDSADLSLNISREILQHDRQLKVIGNSLKKKIKAELLSMQKNDRESYETFYQAFGRQLKFGLYDNYGAEKDFLKDLILFVSSKEKKYVTLEEYVANMQEDQKYIYYACAETVDKADLLPQTESLKEQGIEILYFTEDVDEFAVKMLMSFNEKEFKSVSEADAGETAEIKEENKPLFDFLTESLKEKVKAVKPSSKLKSHPVCLSSEGALSLDMEKTLNTMPGDQKVKAERILEINTDHKIFAKMQSLFDADQDKLKSLASVLYDTALLIEGMPIESPVAFSNALCELLD
ncbi:MAG: molecular chaperone HtpG [Clostridia bacterium]|nr:molecular chaperone HtpG [Clostridia bacterium]